MTPKPWLSVVSSVAHGRMEASIPTRVVPYDTHQGAPTSRAMSVASCRRVGASHGRVPTRGLAGGKSLPTSDKSTRDRARARRDEESLTKATSSASGESSQGE